MRGSMLILALILASAYNMCRPAKPNTARPTSGASTHNPATSSSSLAAPARVDFATQIRPILESRCQPCHFPGGKVYERLPFDRPETINALGTKLFTRIKDESERRLISDFLSKQSDEHHP